MENTDNLPEGFAKLVDILDDMKQNMSDQTYLEAMNSLGSILADYRRISNTDTNEDEDDEDEALAFQIRDRELLINTYFETYMVENNMQPDFRLTKFNLSTNLLYLISMDLCDCSNYNFCGSKWCSNLQKVILKYPLLLTRLYDSDEDINDVCQTIRQYNLLHLDSYINHGNPDNKLQDINLIKQHLNLLDGTYNIRNRIFIIINLFKFVFNIGYLLKQSTFGLIVLRKIRELNEKYSDDLKHELMILGIRDDILDFIVINLELYLNI